MKTIQTLTSGLVAALLSFNMLPAIADDDVMTGTGMGDTTRTTGPTGTPATTGQGESASRLGLVTDPNYPSGISAVRFIEDATEKNYAIINAAELALDEDNGVADDPDIRAIAQQIIEAHQLLDRQMVQLAEAEELEVSDSSTLIDKAQRMVLAVREGESFREAFLNNQIADHLGLIDLFERVTNVDHGEVSRFAENALPKLKAHLETARELQSSAD